MRLEHLLSGARMGGIKKKATQGRTSGGYASRTSRRMFYFHTGGLAQLARALAWHARGQRFDPVILHAVDNRIRMVMNRQTIFDMLLQTKL